MVFVFLPVAGRRRYARNRKYPPSTPFSEYVKPNVTYAIDAYDPWEPINRRIYIFNAIFDNFVFLPVVSRYQFVLPSFARTGINNFFNNLTDVTT